jgi:hypothetical protein
MRPGSSGAFKCVGMVFLVAALLLRTGAASLRGGHKGATEGSSLCADLRRGLLRLRGGGQGLYMDAAQQQQKRGRIRSSHGGGKELFDTMMSLEHFPETLDPLPLQTT